MPTLPIYIRVDDLDKWKSLPNKSEFIHNALNKLVDLPMAYDSEKKELSGKPIGDVLATEAEEDSFDQFLKDYSKPGKRPPHPSYGYPCCHKKAPCLHWKWNEIDSVWVNELTGKIREV